MMMSGMQTTLLLVLVALELVGAQTISQPQPSLPVESYSDDPLVTSAAQCTLRSILATESAPHAIGPLTIQPGCMSATMQPHATSSGKPEARSRTTDGIGSKSRCGVGQIDIDEIVEDAEEAEEHAEADQASGHHGRPEADGRIRGPAEPEEGDHQTRSGEHDRVQALLGRHAVHALLLELVGKACVLGVEVGDIERHGRTPAQEEWDEHDARDTCVEAMANGEDDRERLEEQVDHSIHERQVESHDEQHRFLSQHDERLEQGLVEAILPFDRDELDGGLVALVVGLLADPARLLEQDDGCVRLGQRKDDEHEADTREDGADPEEPPPRCAADGDEARHDRSQRGTGKGSEREERERNASGLGVPQIRNHTTRVGKRRGGESSSKESEDEDGAGILGERASDVEAGVDKHSADKHGTTAVLLGQRAPEQGTKTVSCDKDGQTEDSHLAAESELRFELRDDARRCRRGEGGVEDKQTGEHGEVPSVGASPDAVVLGAGLVSSFSDMELSAWPTAVAASPALDESFFSRSWDCANEGVADDAGSVIWRAGHSTRARSPTGAGLCVPEHRAQHPPLHRKKKQTRSRKKSNCKTANELHQQTTDARADVHGLGGIPPVAPWLKSESPCATQKAWMVSTEKLSASRALPIVLSSVTVLSDPHPVVARTCHTAAVEASRKTSLIHR
ncbi:hypothetical protein L1887_54458 [Cichorium endivia]|nr:hypothetical protein L1887_54458 [Cichorium endivia]